MLDSRNFFPSIGKYFLVIFEAKSLSEVEYLHSKYAVLSLLDTTTLVWRYNCLIFMSSAK